MFGLFKKRKKEKAPRFFYRCSACRVVSPELTGMNVNSFGGWCPHCHQQTTFILVDNFTKKH